MIHLITGTPGSGKTLYAVSLIMAYHKQNQALLEKGEAPRQIYSDIDGLDIDGVEPAPDDWRDTPDGSIIFYDEIQQRDAYKKAKGDNDIVNALQVHRHTGHDIYGITQFPILLHANFNAVVGLHWHLHRGWGLAAATVYQWAYCVTAPNTPSNKGLAENSFRFSYPKDLFQYYKSATVHTHKARIPKKFLLIVFAVLCGVAICYKLLFGTDNFLKKTVSGADATSETANTADANPDAPATGEPAQSISDKQQIADLQQEVDALKQKYLPAHIVEMTKSDELIPVSVVSYRDTCIATNRYGERLNLDHSLCLMMISDPTMMPKARDKGVSTDSINVSTNQPTQSVPAAPAEPTVKTVDNPFPEPTTDL